MPSVRERVLIPSGASSLAGVDIPLPAGKYLTAVHIIHEGNADVPGIFVTAFLSDQPYGTASKEYNVAVILGGIVEDQVTAGVMDQQQGCDWHGSIPLPKEHASWLIITGVNETGTDRMIEITAVYDDLPGGGGYTTKTMKLTWPFGRTWNFRGVMTQQAAGGGSLVYHITIGAGTELIIQSIQLGADDYAAGRTANISILSSAVAVIASLQTASVDNQTLGIPADRVASTAGAVLNSTPQLTRLVGGDDQLIRVRADALAQNETLTVAIRARIRGIKPTVATTGSGGTPSLATTYDKVE